MKKIKKEMSSLVRSNFTPLVETKEGLLLGGFGGVIQIVHGELRDATNNCKCNGNDCQCNEGKDNCNCPNKCGSPSNNCDCGGSGSTTSTTFAKSNVSSIWGSFI